MNEGKNKRGREKTEGRVRKKKWKQKKKCKSWH